jgi:hypothetical protein
MPAAIDDDWVLGNKRGVIGFLNMLAASVPLECRL